MAKLNGEVIPFKPRQDTPRPVTGYVFLLELDSTDEVTVYYSRRGGQTTVEDRATRFKIKQDAEYAAEALSEGNTKWIVRERPFG